MELGCLQSPFCSERQTGGGAQGDCTKGHLFSCTAHSTHTGSFPVALVPPRRGCVLQSPVRQLQLVAVTSIHMETQEREHGCAKEMPDLPDGIQLPNHKGQETWQMPWWNTRRASNTHHCCFPQRNEGTDLITHKLS